MPRPTAKYKLRAMLLVSGATLLSSPHHANALGGSTGSSGQLEEVVVTARHRKEKAQSVPIALTTVSKKQLSDNGVTSVTQLGSFAPSLQVTETNPRNTSFNIRGIGNNVSVTSDGLESGVGVYVDGVIYGRPGNATFSFPDIDAVQVLRGPQGTLFGKNTTSGAIDVRSALPSFTFGADGEASAGNYGFWQVKGTVTGPLSDQVAVRLSFVDDERNGTIDNPKTRETFENVDEKSVRVQLLYKPTEDLTVRVIADYGKQQENCCVPLVAGVFTTLTTGAPLANDFYVRAASLNYTLPPINPFGRNTDVNNRTHFTMDTGGISSQEDYNLNGITLTSITAWRYWNWDPFNDNDFTGLDVIDDASQTNNQKQFSQELRATSAPGKVVDYTAGLYYFYQALPGQFRTAYGPNAGPYLLSPKDSPAFASTILDGFSEAAHTQAITASYAGYGQATYHVLPKLDLTGGLRYTYEDKTGSYDQYQYGGESLAGLTPAQQSQAIATRNSFGAPLYYNDHEHNGSLSWLATLTYKPTPDEIIYGTYSRGNKSGGINVSNLPPGIDAVVKPERVDNYEVGLKSEFLDRKVIFNAAAYWIEDSDYQATVVAPLNSSTFVSYFASVPKVRSRGFEADVNTARFYGLQLRASGSFDDAIYEKFPSGPCPVELVGGATKLCDLTGGQVPGTSRWSFSAGGEYAHDLGIFYNHDITGYFGADYTLRSSFNDTVNNSIYGKIPGFGLLDVRMGARTDDGRYDVFLWSHNATNTKYYQTLSAANTGLITGIVGDPLTWGATVRVHF
jgi:iron complex outermembrane receptor protein